MIKNFFARSFNQPIDYLVLSVILVTRLGFFDGTPDYFDATQYLWRSDSPHLIDALSSGHAPYHPGYIFFSYLFNRLFQLVGFDQLELAVTWPAVVFGSLALLIFYRLTQQLTGSKIAAAIATLTASLAPFIWLGSISILVDPVMWTGFLVGLLYWHRFLTEDKLIDALLSGVGLGLAMFAHTQVGLWVLAYVGFFLAFAPLKKYPRLILRGSLALIPIALFFAGYLGLLLHTGHNDSLAGAAKYLLTDNTDDRGPILLSQSVRLLHLHLSTIGLMMGMLGGLYLTLKQPRLALALLIWFWPGFLLAPSYLYANLYGRAMALGTFPVFMAIGYLATIWRAKNRLNWLLVMALGGLMAQLLVISLPYALKIRQARSPFDELRQIRRGLLQPGLEVTSNLAKTYNDYQDHLVIWEEPREKIELAINQALDKQKPVFIGLDALLFPYYLYDGVIWEVNSVKLPKPLSNHEPLARWIFYKFAANLASWSSAGYKSGEYEVQLADQRRVGDRLVAAREQLADNQHLVAVNLKHDGRAIPGALVNLWSGNELSKQRLNHRDWLYQLYKHRREAADPVVWTATDRTGLAQIAVPINEAQNLSYEIVTYPGMIVAGGRVKFFQRATYPLRIVRRVSGTGNTNDFQQAIEKTAPNSWVVEVSQENDRWRWTIDEVEFDLTIDETIAFRDLPRHVGQIVDGQVLAKATDPAGLASFGPWIELPSGRYQATIRLKTDQETPVEVIATGGQIISQMTISPHPDWQRFRLDWQLNEPVGGVEFRVPHQAGGNLYLDNIELAYESLSD